jgi:hypothetical protein
MNLKRVVKCQASTQLGKTQPPEDSEEDILSVTNHRLCSVM